MPYLGRSIAAAAVSAGVTALVAVFSAQRLSSAPFRGRLPPDPLGSALSLVAFGVGIVAFIWLGRSIGRDGGGARGAIVAGAIGGGLTGLAGGTAQALGLAGYLTVALESYAVPPELLTISLAAYVGIATVIGAIVGAAICYAAWQRSRRPA